MSNFRLRHSGFNGAIANEYIIFRIGEREGYSPTMCSVEIAA